MNTRVEARFLPRYRGGLAAVPSTFNVGTAHGGIALPADPFPPSWRGGTASRRLSPEAAKRNLTQSHDPHVTPPMLYPRAGPAYAGKHAETSGFEGEDPTLSPLCRGKSSAR